MLATIGRKFCKALFEFLKFNKLLSHDCKVRLGKVASVGAIAIRTFHQRDEIANPLNRKVEIAASANKDQSLEVVSTIHPMAAGATHGFWQQANLFVIPNCRNIAASMFREHSDG